MKPNRSLFRKCTLSALFLLLSMGTVLAQAARMPSYAVEQSQKLDPCGRISVNGITNAQLLRELRHEARAHPHFDASDSESVCAQMALAKLGEVQQLSEISCEALYGPSIYRYSAIDYKLSKIGGEWAFELLKRVLKVPDESLIDESPHNWESPHLGNTHTLASRTLEKLARFHGLRVPETSSARPSAEAWVRWIEQQQAELAQLDPHLRTDVFSPKGCAAYFEHERKLRHGEPNPSLDEPSKALQAASVSGRVQ